MDTLVHMMFTSDIPGYDRISRKEYVIRDEDTDLELDKTNWQVKIRPRMQLSMNVVLPAMSTLDPRNCPQCLQMIYGHDLLRQRRRW